MPGYILKNGEQWIKQRGIWPECGGVCGGGQRVLPPYRGARGYPLPALADLTRKLLPLLYFKASLLPPVDTVSEEPLEKYVTEMEYNLHLQKWAVLLGEYDTYQEVFDPELQFGTEAVTASISESLLDIYQDLKDFLTSYSLGNEEVMNDALAECRAHFGEFWGQRLVNVLRALHQLVFSGDLEVGEKKPTEHPEGRRGTSGWVDRFFGENHE